VSAKAAKRAKQDYDPDHYRRVPRVDWDQLEVAQIADLRKALDVVKYNLDVATEEFNRVWRQWEFAERKLAHHAFQDLGSDGHPAEPGAAYVPRKCRLCSLERCAPRHGPVKHHDYVACGASFREVKRRADARCFECGLPKDHPLHITKAL
jgi:hypothetical protein